MRTRHSGPRKPLLLGPSSGIQTLLVVTEVEASYDLHSLLGPPTSFSHSHAPIVPPTQHKRASKSSQQDQLEGVLGLATFIAESEGGIETYEPLSDHSIDICPPPRLKKKMHAKQTAGKRKGKTLGQRKGERDGSEPKKEVCMRAVSPKPAMSQEKLRRSTIHVAIAFFIRGDMQEKRPAID